MAPSGRDGVLRVAVFGLVLTLLGHDRRRVLSERLAALLTGNSLAKAVRVVVQHFLGVSNAVLDDEDMINLLREFATKDGVGEPRQVKDLVEQIILSTHGGPQSVIHKMQVAPTFGAQLPDGKSQNTLLLDARRGDIAALARHASSISQLAQLARSNRLWATQGHTRPPSHFMVAQTDETAVTAEDLIATTCLGPRLPGSESAVMIKVFELTRKGLVRAFCHDERRLVDIVQGSRPSTAVDASVLVVYKLVGELEFNTSYCPRRAPEGDRRGEEDADEEEDEAIYLSPAFTRHEQSSLVERMYKLKTQLRRTGHTLVQATRSALVRTIRFLSETLVHITAQVAPWGIAEPLRDKAEEIAERDAAEALCATSNRAYAIVDYYMRLVLTRMAKLNFLQTMPQRPAPELKFIDIHGDVRFTGDRVEEVTTDAGQVSYDVHGQGLRSVTDGLHGIDLDEMTFQSKLRALSSSSFSFGATRTADVSHVYSGLGLRRVKVWKHMVTKPGYSCYVVTCTGALEIVLVFADRDYDLFVEIYRANCDKFVLPYRPTAKQLKTRAERASSGKRHTSVLPIFSKSASACNIALEKAARAVGADLHIALCMGERRRLVDIDARDEVLHFAARNAERDTPMTFAFGRRILFPGVPVTLAAPAGWSVASSADEEVDALDGAGSPLYRSCAGGYARMRRADIVNEEITAWQAKQLRRVQAKRLKEKKARRQARLARRHGHAAADPDSSSDSSSDGSSTDSDDDEDGVNGHRQNEHYPIETRHAFIGPDGEPWTAIVRRTIGDAFTSSHGQAGFSVDYKKGCGGQDLRGPGLRGIISSKNYFDSGIHFAKENLYFHKAQEQSTMPKNIPKTAPHFTKDTIDSVLGAETDHMEEFKSLAFDAETGKFRRERLCTRREEVRTVRNSNDPQIRRMANSGSAREIVEEDWGEHLRNPFLIDRLALAKGVRIAMISATDFFATTKYYISMLREVSEKLILPLFSEVSTEFRDDTPRRALHLIGVAKVFTKFRRQFWAQVRCLAISLSSDNLGLLFYESRTGKSIAAAARIAARVEKRAKERLGDAALVASIVTYINKGTGWPYRLKRPANVRRSNIGPFYFTKYQHRDGSVTYSVGRSCGGNGTTASHIGKIKRQNSAIAAVRELIKELIKEDYLVHGWTLETFKNDLHHWVDKLSEA